MLKCMHVQAHFSVFWLILYIYNILMICRMNVISESIWRRNICKKQFAEVPAKHHLFVISFILSHLFSVQQESPKLHIFKSLPT